MLFTDEIYMYAKDMDPQQRLRQEKRYEPLRVMIWAAVDYKGPRALAIMEENMNANNYKQIWNEVIDKYPELFQG